ncbi:NusG domain II-containing protein [Treponema sp.]|uniref:NusG domain II-containing protein n=1 Tax=Treponema sp. TaxID=166 RepID=UPI0025E19DA9|nr:NusG domain II-containing protein [Treponema sp.]MCR5218960.1 NusG domain II-containing protein [Treponema sp.]
MRKIRILDFVIVAALMAAGIYLIFKNSLKKGNTVVVKAGENEYEYSAKADGIYKVHGLLGITTFEIKDRKVRIIDSPCQNKNCVNQGWHSPLVCLPNEVIITIEDQGEDYDAIAE